MPAPREAVPSISAHLEALLADWFDARAGGSDPSPEELTSTPELWAPLRDYIAAARAMELGDTSIATMGAPETVDSAVLPQPPGYRISGEIARGGMGIVYAAEDLTFGREVAVKVLKPGPDAVRPVAVARFAKEARVTGQLEHPSIPPVHALGALPDGRPFLAMKLVRGKTLADLLSAPNGTPRATLLSAFERICEAVGYAHSKGIVHRDLKPANIMVGAFGEVQVMDWGLAREPGAAHTEPETGTALVSDPAALLTQAGHVMGTPAYMAPEQARGEPIDARADVFALGGVLCAILTGQPTFTGARAGAVIGRAAAADVSETFARLDSSGADPDLIRLARTCLAPNPSARPPDGNAVAESVVAHRAGVETRLRAAERDRAAAEAKATEAENTRREAEARLAEQRKRRRTQAALAAAVILILAGGAGFGWWADRKAGQERERIAVDEANRKQSELDLSEQKRARQVESHQAALQLAVQRGDTSAAVGEFDRAVAEGLPVTPEMRLIKARALAHSMNRQGALDELARIDRAGLSESTRARTDLLTGALLLGSAEEERGIELVRAAVAAEAALPEAEREYARGLLAENVVEALRRFRAAIDLDPSHVEARGLSGIALLTLGRLDELIALAKESRALAPRHPIFPLLLAFAYGLSENRAEAAHWVSLLRTHVPDAEDMALLKDVVEVLPEVRATYRSASGADAKPNPAKLVMFFMFRLPKLTEKSGAGVGAFEALRMPRALRDGLRIIVLELTAASQRLTGANLSLPDRFVAGWKQKLGFSDAAGEAEARKLLAAHPEGTLALIFAFSKMGQGIKARNEKTPGWREKLAEAAATLEEAARTPSLFGTQAAALDLAIVYYLHAGFDKPGAPARPEYAAKALELVRRRLQMPDPIIASARSIYCFAARDARQFGFARYLLDEWRGPNPPTGDMPNTMAWIEFLDEHFERAIAIAEEFLTGRPDTDVSPATADLREIRDKSRERLRLLPVAPRPREVKK